MKKIRKESRAGECKKGGGKTRQTEICELNATVSRDEDTRGTDAPVHDTVLGEIEHAQRIMRCSQRKARGLHGAQQLRRHVKHKAFIYGLSRAPELLDDVGERTLQRVSAKE